MLGGLARVHTYPRAARPNDGRLIVNPLSVGLQATITYVAYRSNEVGFGLQASCPHHTTTTGGVAFRCNIAQAQE